MSSQFPFDERGFAATVFAATYNEIENNNVAGVAGARARQKTDQKKWALLVWGSGNGHPGYAYFCPGCGSAKSVRRGHRARPDSRYDLEANPVAGGRALGAAVRSDDPVDPHHRGGGRVSRPRRAHPFGDRGSARQRRRQGEQAQGQAKDCGACLPRPPLCGPGAVRFRARLSRDRRASGPARPAGQPAGGWL
jgi:hypothetical protein